MGLTWVPLALAGLALSQDDLASPLAEAFCLAVPYLDPGDPGDSFPALREVGSVSQVTFAVPLFVLMEIECGRRNSLS